MKQYKTTTTLLKALREGRIQLPPGAELILESKGSRIISQVLQTVEDGMEDLLEDE